MSVEDHELLIDPDSAAWMPLAEGIDVKILRISEETGTWTVLLKGVAGSSFARHRHLGAGEYYVVQGRIDYRAGTAVTGNYGYEPLGVIHDETTFVEDTILFFTNHGAVAFIDDADQVTDILNHETLLALAAQHTSEAVSAG